MYRAVLPPPAEGDPEPASMGPPVESASAVVMGHFVQQFLDAVEVVVNVLVRVQVLHRTPHPSVGTPELPKVLLSMVGVLVIALYLPVKMTRLAVQTVKRFERVGFPVVVRILLGGLVHVVRRLFQFVRQVLDPVWLSDVRLSCVGCGSQAHDGCGDKDGRFHGTSPFILQDCLHQEASQSQCQRRKGTGRPGEGAEGAPFFASYRPVFRTDGIGLETKRGPATNSVKSAIWLSERLIWVSRILNGSV